jgi:hypothetical protein
VPSPPALISLQEAAALHLRQIEVIEEEAAQMEAATTVDEVGGVDATLLPLKVAASMAHMAAPMLWAMCLAEPRRGKSGARVRGNERPACRGAFSGRRNRGDGARRM